MKFKLLPQVSLFICFLFLGWSVSEEVIDIELLAYFLKDVKLRKCNCQSDEIFVNNTCLQSETNTTVSILLFRDMLNSSFHFNTNLFNVLPNSGMKCSFDKYVTRIHPRDLHIMLTGELIHTTTNVTYSPFQFCVEHILNENYQVEWEVEMCMEPINVPMCCPPKQKCAAPSLPIGYGNSMLKDPVIETSLVEPIQCDEGELISKVDIPSPSIYMSYINKETNLIVFSNTDSTFKPMYLNNEEFCLIPETKNDKMKYKTSFCTKDPILEHQVYCKGFSCVRKCCPQGQVYSSAQRNCIDYAEKHLWKPIFRHRNYTLETEAPDNLKMTFGFPICKNSFYALKPKDPKDKSFLLDNGEMYVRQWGESTPSPRYCMENFLSKTNEIVHTALTCFPDVVAAETKCQRVKSILFPILLIVSCVFLLITLVVYASIPELHAKLHGKSLLSHVAALFTAYMFLAIVKWMSHKLSMEMCRTFAFIIQISFLSSFFWLNVMCFDIWWTLRSMRPVAETSESFRRRFAYYSVYAWGCPLAISIVTLTMEMLPRTEEYAHLILPGFGDRNCWFQDNTSLWIYFYSFVSILTLMNVLFFICVALILLQAQRANNGILRTTSKQHQERVWIYLKLFVVMGITWLSEIVSWQEGSCEYWLVTDIFNSLQGFFIFLIFICKKNIFAKLRTRGTASTRKIKRMVQGSSSSGASSQVTAQSSLDSSRKLSTSLHYHLSKLSKMSSGNKAERGE